MAILSFRGISASSGIAGIGQSVSTAYVVLASNPLSTYLGTAWQRRLDICVCRIRRSGEFGSTFDIENIEAGVALCNTARGGHRIGADNEGRTIPHDLIGKYVDIAVDCGGFFGRRHALTQVSFRVSECRPDGNRGNVLYHWDRGDMRIFSRHIGSDFAISGLARKIPTKRERQLREMQVMFNMSPEEVDRNMRLSHQALQE